MCYNIARAEYGHTIDGEVLKWSKRRDSKSRRALTCRVGSNPTFSASKNLKRTHGIARVCLRFFFFALFTIRFSGTSKCHFMFSESFVQSVLHNPYFLDIESFFAPHINKYNQLYACVCQLNSLFIHIYLLTFLDCLVDFFVFL